MPSLLSFCAWARGGPPRFLIVRRSEQLVELVELGLEQLLVRELGFILGDHGRGEGAAEGIFDHLAVLGGAEQQADGWVFVGLADIAVKGFEVEVEFAEVLGLEAGDLEFDGDEAVQPAVEEEQIEREVLPADLDRDTRNRRSRNRGPFR